MKYLIYLIILTTIGCTSNKYNNVVGITIGEAIAKYEIKLESFVTVNPPGTPVAVYGYDSNNQLITLFFEQNEFVRKPGWKLKHFNNKIIIGIAIKTKEKKINYGRVPGQ